VLFLHGIEGSVADDGRGGGGGGGEDEGPPPDGQIDVVFAGYSYGSLVTTRLPDLAALLAPFSTLAPGESAREVAGRARKLAGQASGGALRPAAPGHGRRSSGQQQRQRQRQRREGGSAEGACAADEAEGEAGRGGVDGASPTATTTTTTPASRPETGGDPAPSTPSPPKTTVPQSPFPLALNTHYLLVSPLLPPISTLTALPLFSPDTDTDEAHLKKFRESPSLAVFGSRDIFTSARRLAAWCEERRGANARFDWFEVPGAGHFWHERGAMAEANRHVREWVRRSVGVK
jgi:pimeloyl-ACP methyl ester carboxylesterase